MFKAHKKHILMDFFKCLNFVEEKTLKRRQKPVKPVKHHSSLGYYCQTFLCFCLTFISYLAYLILVPFFISSFDFEINSLFGYLSFEISRGCVFLPSLELFLG